MTETTMQLGETILREPFPERDGIVEAIGPLTGRNRVAAAFYDGPGWRRFRPWEHAFLALQGGQERARRPILNHLLQGGSSLATTDPPRVAGAEPRRGDAPGAGRSREAPSPGASPLRGSTPATRGGAIESRD